jgi:hypothetical protein
MGMGLIVLLQRVHNIDQPSKKLRRTAASLNQSMPHGTDMKV